MSQATYQTPDHTLSIDIREPPKLISSRFNEIGQVDLVFDQPIIVMPETNKLKFKTSSRGLQGGEDVIDFGQLVEIKLLRGDVDSLLED